MKSSYIFLICLTVVLVLAVIAVILYFVLRKKPTRSSSSGHFTGLPSFDNMTADVRFVNNIKYNDVPQDITIYFTAGTVNDPSNYTAWQPVNSTNPTIKTVPTYGMPDNISLKYNDYYDFYLPSSGVASLNYKVRINGQPIVTTESIDSKFEMTVGCAYVESPSSTLQTNCAVNPALINVQTNPDFNTWLTNGGRFAVDGTPIPTVTSGPFMRDWSLGGSQLFPSCPDYLDISYVDGITIPMGLYMKKRTKYNENNNNILCSAGNSNVIPGNNGVGILADCSNLTHGVNPSQDCPILTMGQIYIESSPGTVIPAPPGTPYGQGHEGAYNGIGTVQPNTSPWYLDTTMYSSDDINGVKIGCAQPCHSLTNVGPVSQIYNGATDIAHSGPKRPIDPTSEIAGLGKHGLSLTPGAVRYWLNPDGTTGPTPIPGSIPVTDQPLIPSDIGVNQYCCAAGLFGTPAGCNAYVYNNDAANVQYVQTVRAGGSNGNCKAYAWQYDDVNANYVCNNYDATNDTVMLPSGDVITARNKYMVIFGSSKPVIT